MDGPSLRNPTKALDYLHSRLPSDLRRPAIGVICGSGLSGIANTMQNKEEIPYTEIPDFPHSTGATKFYSKRWLHAGLKQSSGRACWRFTLWHITDWSKASRDDAR